MCNMFPFIGKVLHTIKGFRPASPAPCSLEKEWWAVDGFTNVNHTFLCSYMAFPHHDFIFLIPHPLAMGFPLVPSLWGEGC